MLTCDRRDPSLPTHVISTAQPLVERGHTLQRIRPATQRPRRQPLPIRTGQPHPDHPPPHPVERQLPSAAKRPTMTMEPQWLGDGLGFVFREDGGVVAIMNVDVSQGAVTQVWIVLARAKLTSWRTDRNA